MDALSPVFPIITCRTPAAAPAAVFRSSLPIEIAKPAPKCLSLNQNRDGTLSKKVLIPIGFGTEEMEAVIMIDVFRRAGAAVIVASVEEQLEVEGSSGTKLVADDFITSCSSEVFDLIALPGGMPGSARLRDCKVLQQITCKQAEEKRLYSAICAAPAVTLLPWGLVKRKQTTCHPSFSHKLPTFWAVKSNLQVSGELTTSRGPGTCFEFAVSLVEQLYGETAAKDISDAMLLSTGANDIRVEEFNEVSWSLDHTPKIMVPVANGCEEVELVAIVDILRRAKAEVVVASLEKSRQILGSKGVNIIADTVIRAAAETIYDLIILPGGISGTERLSKSRILRKLLNDQVSAGRFVGASCSMPALLQKRGFLKEKRATAHPSVIGELNGAVNGTQVVIDGQFITSKGLSTAINFGLAIVSKLFSPARAKSVAEGLVFDYPRRTEPEENAKEHRLSLHDPSL